jgi:hypothetical protein
MKINTILKVRWMGVFKNDLFRVMKAIAAKELHGNE